MSDNPETRFIGREGFIEEIEESWNRCRVSGIFGMKSVGKSRVVRELLKRPSRLEDRHILVDMQGKGQMKMLLLQLLTALKLYEFKRSEFNETSRIQMILQELQHLANQVHIVMTLDNSETLIEKGKNNLISFISDILQIENIHLIITSNISMMETDFPGVEVFLSELHPLTPSESYTLLNEIAPDIGRADGEAISELCCGLPLALMMVGAELASSDSVFTTTDILEVLTHCRLQSLNNEFYPASERIGLIYHRLILQLSHLFQQRLAALHYIPVSFKRQQAKEILVDDDSSDGSSSIEYLHTRHMLMFDPLSSRYNIHGILRDCIQVFVAIQDIAGVRARYCKTFAAVFRDINDKLGTTQFAEAVAQLSLEFPNLQKLLAEVEYSNGDTYHVFVELVSSSCELLHEYMGGEALAFYQKCLDITPMYGRPLDEAILKVGQGKALIICQAQFKASEKCYRESIELIKDLPISPTHVALYTALGRSLQAQTRKKESLSALELALNIAGRLGMVDDDLLLSAFISIATVHSTSENYDASEQYLQRALNLCLAKFKTDQHILVAEIYNAFGLMNQTRTKYDTAFDFFKKALDVRRNIKAGVRPLVLSLNNCAMQSSIHGNNEEAIKLLKEAKMSLDRLPGAQKYAYVVTLENLGRLNHRMGNLDSAMIYMNEVLDIRRNVTPGNVNVVEMLELLGNVYFKKQRYTECMNTFEEAISCKQSTITHYPGYQLILYCYVSLMDVLAHEGRLDRLREVTSEARDEIERLTQFHLPRNNPIRTKLYRGKFQNMYDKVKHLLG